VRHILGRTEMQTTETIADDRLEGAEQIAAFLGVPLRRARWLIQSGKLPCGHEGPQRLVASKRRLREWWDSLTSGKAA
jgi:hypothetical protein